MRVAVFSDVHGNTIALDAVIADVEAAGGVDAFWFIGDAVALGHDPIGAVERIRDLPNLVAVRGNTDRHTISDDADADAAFIKLAATDPDAAKTTFAIVRGFDWTRGAITLAGQFDWVANLPVEARAELPDRTRVLLVHAAPGTDDGPGIIAGQSDQELAALLDGIDADLVVVGHTHKPLDRTVGDVRVINLGSVSMPVTDDFRAMWTLLEADSHGYRIARRFAAYNYHEFVKQIAAVHHPTETVVRRRYGLG